MSAQDEPRYPSVTVPLVDQDGNAWAIMGRVACALRKVGAPRSEVDQFRAECMSGSYDDLLRTVMRWVQVK